MLINRGNLLVNLTLNNRKMKMLLDNFKFDLVIVDLMYTEAFLGLGQHFNCPVIAVSTLGVTKTASNLVGNISPLSYVPHQFSWHYTDSMSFLQRIEVVAMTIYDYFYLYYYHHPAQV